MEGEWCVAATAFLKARVTVKATRWMNAAFAEEKGLPRVHVIVKATNLAARTRCKQFRRICLRRRWRCIVPGCTSPETRDYDPIA